MSPPLSPPNEHPVASYEVTAQTVTGLLESNAIQLWPWKLAPQKWKCFSSHGGDEDWVALVPLSSLDSSAYRALDTLAVCNCQEIELTHQGQTVGVLMIGAHA